MAAWLDARFAHRLDSFRLDVSLEMGPEIGILFGPSGAGKSQTLRVLAGLTRPEEGSIRLNGRDLADLPPGMRKIGLVFQELALFPHLSVVENVAYGLKGPDRLKKARHWLSQVRLDGFEKRLPHQLSGGQRQRVALARALVLEPELLLLDEPLAAVDMRARGAMRKELRSQIRSAGIPCIVVTHALRDVLELADRICLLEEGKVVADGTPGEVLGMRENAFIASFVDSRVPERPYVPGAHHRT